jgi:hypothetical protein
METHFYVTFIKSKHACIFMLLSLIQNMLVHQLILVEMKTNYYDRKMKKKAYIYI